MVTAVKVIFGLVNVFYDHVSILEDKSVFLHCVPVKLEVVT